ncbi:MAG: LacI family transcriptional regulator [Clostridiales bacterium]|nr:LacI family transcriptional regulator [Clostridiales bacterium]
MKQEVSIYDIAKMVGVSPATVSNVINGRLDKVSERTRAKVLECMNDTGYRTNMVARNLVTGKSMLIGVCLPMLEIGAKQSDLLENNPFYHEFIDGVHRVLLDNGYECIVRGMDDNFKYLEWIQNRSLDGLIDLGNLSDSLYDQLGKLNVPTVLVDNYNVWNTDRDVILSDDADGVYAAVKHLLDLGHKRIAFVCNNVTLVGVDAERYQGYKRALKEYGVSEEFVYRTITDFRGGAEFGRRIVDEKLPVTAVMCTADITALGIVRGIAERGKKVPDDYSIVGYDDIRMLNFISSELTTVRQNIFEKGCLCAKILLDKINNPNTHKAEKTVIKSELIIRNSTRSVL